MLKSLSADETSGGRASHSQEIDREAESRYSPTREAVNSGFLSTP
jgi:hypothetical protein